MKRPFLKIRIINSILITAILIFLIGCEKEDTTPKITDIKGNWSGTTSLNDNVSFSVSNNSITEFNITIATSGGSSDYTYLSLGNVVDNTFSYTVEMFGKSNITGEFISNSSSKGTFDIETTSGTKWIGTWTATKQ